MSRIPASPLGQVYRTVAEQFLTLADSADREQGVPEYVTPTEAATALKVNVHTIYRRIRSGRLEAVRVGDQYRIPVAAIRELAS